MTRSSLRAAVLAGTPDELETAFYDALRAGDVERVMACWADEDEIVCIHPGGPRLVGQAAIRTAFAAMLRHGGLGVQAQRLMRVQALASSVHSVLEHVSVMLPDGPRDAVVCATNVYHKTPRGWRLVAHHASPGAEGEGDAPSPAAHVLH
ncbi:MAG: nuclear transport factor 2 family protein [Comamonadaceae bacterium]|nr:nuclear transport factor 2 family protein [Pseudomonadota bacterium]MBS0608331.1 nuclear transport factor 2 family protein [Pseudomonadota bacterium]MDE2415668.1 nuclear transport factor 2 family protein [Comamonadaceae bacterium]